MPYPLEGRWNGKGEGDFYACGKCELAGRTSYELCGECASLKTHCNDCILKGRCVIKKVSKSEAEPQFDRDTQLDDYKEQKEGSVLSLGHYLKRIRKDRK